VSVLKKLDGPKKITYTVMAPDGVTILYTHIVWKEAQCHIEHLGTWNNLTPPTIQSWQEYVAKVEADNTVVPA
jgi:hypothetical protein